MGETPNNKADTPGSGGNLAPSAGGACRVACATPITDALVADHAARHTLAVEEVPELVALARSLERRLIAAEKALEALRDVLADHNERVSIYGEAEQQPHRVRVMDAGKAALQAYDAEKGQP